MITMIDGSIDGTSNKETPLQTFCLLPPRLKYFDKTQCTANVNIYNDVGTKQSIPFYDDHDDASSPRLLVYQTHFSSALGL